MNLVRYNALPQKFAHSVLKFVFYSREGKKRVFRIVAATWAPSIKSGNHEALNHRSPQAGADHEADHGADSRAAPEKKKSRAGVVK